MGEDDPVEMLLVDDDASDIELMLRAFKENNLGGRVHAVANGAEALDFIFCSGAYSGRDIKSLPKVILLDLNLPKVNGKEVLRRIKSDERTQSIPVVIMSSSQQETDVAECYKLGASHYVVKAVGFEKLTEALKQLRQH